MTKIPVLLRSTIWLLAVLLFPPVVILVTVIINVHPKLGTDLLFYLRIILNIIAGWFFLRAFLYKLLKIICVAFEKKDLYSDIRYKKTLSIFATFRIVPPLKYDETRQKQWGKMWWGYGLVFIICLIITTIM